MYHLLVYESQRSGEVEITPGTYGCLTVVTGAPILTAFAKSETLKFDFEIENQKGGKFTFSDVFSIENEKPKSVTLASEAGSVTVTVVIVTPYNRLNEPMDVEFSQAVKIGHRGAGSNIVVKDYCENTIPGFEVANERGADFVEFDVQLAIDGTPVIHHDFYVHLNHKHELGEPINEEPAGTFNYAIQQFTVQQFCDCGLEKEWKVPMPTFKQLIVDLPANMQFDVEVKYPFHPRFSGVVPYPERNVFIDRFLDDLADFGHDRKLFFSSFDTYIVLMLCLKQKRWPVFQLVTQEEGIEDLDTFVNKTLAMAPILKAFGVKGFVLNSMFMLKHEIMVKQLLDMGFLVFTYGDPNNTKDGVHHQLDIGITGICTDKLVDLAETLACYKKPE